MRVPQPKAEKGSQKWIQDIINTCPEFLNGLIQGKLASLSEREICWTSPLKQDEYAEYRDADLRNQIGLTELTGELIQILAPKWTSMGCLRENNRR